MMKLPPYALTCQLLLLTALLAGTASAGAVTIVECIDDDGQSSFRDRCPPGTHKKGEKRLQGKIADQRAEALKAAAEQHPVTLYAAPGCDACDAVRAQLQQRGIPFTDKDASKDVAVQDELRQLTGNPEGQIIVPVVHVDQDVLTDFNNRALYNALDRAGYPPASPAGEAAAAAGSGTATPAANTHPAPATSAAPASPDGGSAASPVGSNKDAGASTNDSY